MTPAMKKKLSVFIIIASLVAITGCIKDTYEIDKLSKEVHLTPGFGVSVLNGTITLSDLVESNDTISVEADTIFIDDNNVVSFIFRKDSVISFNLEDYYDIDSLLSYEKSFEVGELNLGSFRDTILYSLDEISMVFPPLVRGILVALDGFTGDFPGFPSVILDQKTFGPLQNFEYATFSEGIIEVSVINNLSIPITGLSIQLYNAEGPTPVGDPLTYSSLDPDETGTDSLDLANVYLSDSIIAAVVLSNNPGADNVPIDLNNDNIEFRLTGRNLSISSGKVILPVQKVLSVDEADTVSFNPGDSIEIAEIKILNGYLTYNLNALIPIKTSLSITLPTSLRDNEIITEIIEIEPDAYIKDSISLVNSTLDLSTITDHQYNRLPVNYSVEVSSDGKMVEFNSTDEVSIDIGLNNPEIDYVKGYFGQYGDTIDADTLDLEIKDMLKNVSGSFLISSPSVRLNYSNSFAIPVVADLNVVGYRTDDSVDLDLDPVTLGYPAAPSERDKDGIVTVDKNNSQLPEIISMPPEKIHFGGSAVMNPDGNTGARDNYIFSNSRFLGDLEVEVPLEFRLNNLHYADTMDNPVQDEDFSDSPVNPEDIETLKILLDIENGFPFGISFSVSLYDSTTQSIKSTVNVADILAPATVDASGRVTAPAQCSTEIALTNDFWKWINDADKIIFSITLVSSDGGTKDVKIYSDYYLNYKAALFIKPDIQFSFE